jgi:hypothetical protein
VAAFAQQQHVAIDHAQFDHNATYHMLLLPALALLYSGFVRLAEQRALERGTA